MTTDAPDEIQRQVWIRGRVQGVSFRASLLRYVESQEMPIQGYVKNLADGRVEAVFQGAPNRVLSCVAWCRVGPQGASVEELTVKEMPIDPQLTRFQILR